MLSDMANTDFLKVNDLKAVELFAGIGGFRFALDQRGIKTIWANDILPEACTVYRNQFGNEGLVEGDIRTLIDQIPQHDLLTGGFPCQPFSSAGKKKGIKDPRGTLFEVIVKILEKNQPKFFILENVKRLLAMEDGFHFATILSALAELDYRIEWRLLNAMNFGLPQNRQRVVLLGRHLRQFSSDQLDDLSEIKLADSDELFDLPDDQILKLNSSHRWDCIENHGRAFSNWGIACKGKYFTHDLQKFSSIQPPVFLKDVLQQQVEEEFDLTESTLQRIGQNKEINKYVGGVEIISNQAGGARMGYTIFGINGLAPTLTSSTSRHYERYKIGEKYRRLTNIEYARIQGFPDKHCDDLALRHQYFLYGNAVPPPLVGWVMDRMLSKPEKMIDIKFRQPLTLFAHAY